MKPPMANCPATSARETSPPPAMPPSEIEGSGPPAANPMPVADVEPGWSAMTGKAGPPGTSASMSMVTGPPPMGSTCTPGVGGLVVTDPAGPYSACQAPYAASASLLQGLQRIPRRGPQRVLVLPGRPGGRRICPGACPVLSLNPAGQVTFFVSCPHTRQAEWACPESSSAGQRSSCRPSASRWWSARTAWP